MTHPRPLKSGRLVFLETERTGGKDAEDGSSACYPPQGSGRFWWKSKVLFLWGLAGAIPGKPRSVAPWTPDLVADRYLAAVTC
jgi:hypothetical protein